MSACRGTNQNQARFADWLRRARGASTSNHPRRYGISWLGIDHASAVARNLQLVY